MNRESHIIIGILAFLGYSYLIYSIIGAIPNGFIWGLLAAFIGSIIPDILEPASSWTHRGICHSKRALKFTSIIFIITAFIGFLSFISEAFIIIYIISGFFLGYLFHLLADATTPVGLPW